MDERGPTILAVLGVVGAIIISIFCYQITSGMELLIIGGSLVIFFGGPDRS